VQQGLKTRKSRLSLSNSNAVLRVSRILIYPIDLQSDYRFVSDLAKTHRGKIYPRPRPKWCRLFLAAGAELP